MGQKPTTSYSLTNIFNKQKKQNAHAKPPQIDTQRALGRQPLVWSLGCCYNVLHLKIIRKESYQNISERLSDEAVGRVVAKAVGKVFGMVVGYVFGKVVGTIVWLNPRDGHT